MGDKKMFGFWRWMKLAVHLPVRFQQLPVCAPQASRYSLITVVRSNSSMAAGLAAGRALTGRWQTALAEAARVEALTAADVRDVAARTFTPDNCFTGFVLPEARALG